MSCKVSVVIPVYNGEAYLRACVASVQKQTLREIEILIVDDGSTDGSGELADALAAEDTRIRVMHQENQGLSGARNTGIEAATGEFIGFVDADDIAAPDMYEKLYTEAVSLSCDVVTCTYRSFRKEGFYKPNIPLLPMHERLSPQQVRSVMPHMNRDGSLMFVWRRLYAASLFREKGIRFDTRFGVCEDATFCMECLLRADGAAAIPDCLYYHRFVQDSLIRSQRYNPYMTDAMLLQYTVKCELGDAYMHRQRAELSQAMAQYTYRHIAHLVLRNLFRKTGGGKYREFCKFVRAPILRDMFRYLDIDAFRSKSLDWVMFKLIGMHLYVFAYGIAKYIYGKDSNNG